MIHETAIVEDGARIGKNTNIWHFAHIRNKARIGDNCNIGKDVYIDVNVEVGDNCKIQNFATIYDGVTIGSNVFIGPHVCFTNDFYPRAFLWDEQRLTKTIVHDGASIGANSTIIAGVSIGKYALVGAGSVVTKDVPDHAMMYGNPAKLHGFVCECGRPVSKTKTTKTNIFFICSECKKELSIPINIYQEVKE